jgi:proliferating cell nuclear antigen
MTIIFKSKTNEGFTIKVLSELLQNSVRLACMEITRQGINMRMMDSHRHILLDISLESTNFNVYYLSEEKMHLGINLGHLYKMIKSIKKKDSVMFVIDDATPDALDITIYPKENNRVIKTSIRIHFLQQVSIPLPVDYCDPIIIPSGDYQKILKDMSNISKTLIVNMKKYSMKISCSADIYSKEALFGELHDESAEYYHDTFDIDKFIRILKIAGLSNNLHVYSGSKTRPIRIASSIGNLGKISIYIKSQEQIRLD